MDCKAIVLVLAWHQLGPKFQKYLAKNEIKMPKRKK